MLLGAREIEDMETSYGEKPRPSIARRSRSDHRAGVTPAGDSTSGAKFLDEDQSGTPDRTSILRPLVGRTFGRRS